MKFGRLNRNRLVDFAPAGMPDEWYQANGWLPVETVQKPHAPDGKIYVFAGYEETNGVLRKTFALRDAVEEKIIYSRQAVLDHLQSDNGGEYINILSSEHLSVYEELLKHEKYVKGCDFLNEAISAYADLYNMSFDKSVDRILTPSEIKP